MYNIILYYNLDIQLLKLGYPDVKHLETQQYRIFRPQLFWVIQSYGFIYLN